MNATRRPRIPRGEGRHIAESVGEVVRQRAVTPDDSFRDGVAAHQHLNAMMLREEDIGESLHGPDRVVRFPRHLIALFAALGKPQADTLLTLANLGKGEVDNLVTFASLPKPEQDALLRLARREADRTVLGKVWGRAWKAGMVIAVPAYGVAKWGWDQIPFVKQIIAAIKGAGS